MSNKVLIVEDEFIVANDLRLILEQAGYMVSGIADSVEEAEKILLQQRPDLVLLDIQLTGKLSGIDMARKLRAENIAFVYVSANSNKEILDQAKTTEPYGFLVKPFRETDLLVTLDIAWYRHQHSLESKLRQEEHLRKSLAEVNNESSSAEKKLLQRARVIQSYLPFDFIATGPVSNSVAQFNDIGYLRTGFDEYQFIGEKELLTITGLNKNKLSNIIRTNPSDSLATIYNDAAGHQIPALQKIILDTFQLQSYIAFPITMSNGETIHYFFYSRQLDIYRKHHLDLLNRLKSDLIDLPGRTSPGQIESQPDVVAKKYNDGVEGRQEFKNIIGSHHLLLAALDLTSEVAPYNTSVLILGESGTGKEKVAQSIHSISPRRNGSFIKVNCAAIPPTLIESELFGHEKGAFTGATEKRKGKFELANNGTIFLDEIGELPLTMQVKLLRVLQEREIEYVGGSSPVKVNVRIVAATNRNLEKEVAQGNFRLDLYYRLNVFPITLPSLRERKSDIEALAYYFAERICRESNKKLMGFSSAMIADMMKYDWPGNIRELENVVEQAVILNDGKSKLELRRKLIPNTAESFDKANIKTLEDIKQVKAETEREYIIAALKKTNGRIRGMKGAAEILKIKPTTLESKIAKLNISKEDL